MAAPTSTIQILRDGARNYVVKATFISGGADQPLTLIANSQTGNPPWGTHCKVHRVDYDIIPGGLVRLSWDPVGNPTDILDLGGFDHKSFKFMGGLPVNPQAVASGSTGSILVNTQGFSLGYQYTVIIELIKGV